MRAWFTFAALSCLPLGAVLACKSAPDQPPERVSSSTPTALGSALPTSAPNAAPSSSAALALEKEIQARKLPVPAAREHAPRLAFGSGVFGQLTQDALRVFDLHDFQLLISSPLESPRALLALADGALLAIGARQMLRWEPGKKTPKALVRPVLLPGAEVYADPQAADLIWVFDPGSGASAAPSLSSFRLIAGDKIFALPEQTIELASARGGVFGVTREGVWLYVTPGHGERLSPGGLRLAGLTSSEISPPTWVLRARRLDQSLWLDEGGQVSRVLVSPSFKPLGRATLAGKAFAADVGDEGRLLAVSVVNGDGPRFELQLFNNELEQLARVALPSDPPTGTEDWVKVVTQNQGVVASAREARVAVGGPGRATIFDGQGKQIFSIPSQ
jgi:hypothetical protein